MIKYQKEQNMVLSVTVQTSPGPALFSAHSITAFSTRWEADTKQKDGQEHLS